MDIYDRVDALCKKHHLSKRQLSIACGFNPSTVAKWKYHMPTTDKVRKVAEYFDVPTAWLLGEIDEQTNVQRTYYTEDETEKKAQELSDDQHAVMKAIPHLPPQRVKILRAMLEEWKDTNPNG